MIRAAIVASALAAGAALAASPMQPGQWESTVSVMRSGRVPLISADTDCIAQKEIDDGTKSLPRPGDNCDLSNVATVDGKTTYDFVCRDGDVVRKGNAEFVIEATRYAGKLDVTARKGSGPETATSLTWTAHRVGACK